MNARHGCPECGSTIKRHSDEDCDRAQAVQDAEDEKLIDYLRREAARSDQ